LSLRVLFLVAAEFPIPYKSRLGLLECLDAREGL